MTERADPTAGADEEIRLIAAFRGGDSSAGKALQEHFRPALVRLCRSYIPPGDVEDALQEIFYNVLRTAEVPRKPRAWIYRIARNHCLNRMRARRRRKDEAALPPFEDADAQLTGQLTRLVRAERRDAVGRAMGMLTFEQQEVLRLRYAEGFSRGEIAEVLDVSESIVKSRIYEGLKLLREFTLSMQS